MQAVPGHVGRQEEPLRRAYLAPLEEKEEPLRRVSQSPRGEGRASAESTPSLPRKSRNLCAELSQPLRGRRDSAQRASQSLFLGGMLLVLSDLSVFLSI